MRAYRNGTLVGTGAPAPQIYIYGAIAGSVVGIFNFGLSDYQTLPDANFYAGSMADFRVWNRALTPAELSSHVASQPATNAPGLVNWIPFNETTGNTFQDIVGGLTGTYYNIDFVSGPVLSCIPHRATATAQVVNGFIVGITITDPGCGYTNTSPPAVIFRDSTGTGATATAIVNNDGTIERIQIDTNGRDYTDSVRILIAPPPFLPTLTIGVSRVNVTMSVVLGRRYQLESSANLATWSPEGDPFVAQDDTVTQEFVVQDTRRYFRINEVP
jgi:hypothetical protein